MFFGIFGTLVPVLPVIPFFLGMLFFFAKSSQELYDWFVSTKIYKRYLKTLVKDRSLPLKVKIVLLAYALAASAALFLAADMLASRIFIVVMFAVRYITILFFIKTTR